MNDIGYLRHCLSVYLLGFVAVILFIFFNGGQCKNLKEFLIGSVVMIFVYTLIMLLIFIAMPMLSV